MKMYNFKIISRSIRLFSILLAPLVFFSMPVAQAGELNLYQKGYTQLPYVVDVSPGSRDAKVRNLPLTWLLNNSVVENGAYSLNLTQSKQDRNGGRLGSKWGDLDLKLKFEFFPKPYSQATFPGMSEPHFSKDDFMTSFRVNRSRVMFTVGTHWD